MNEQEAIDELSAAGCELGEDNDHRLLAFSAAIEALEAWAAVRELAMTIKPAGWIDDKATNWQAIPYHDGACRSGPTPQAVALAAAEKIRGAKQ